MRLSIVVPAYNEAAAIRTFHEQLLVPELKKLSLTYEVIYVNDGSIDDTLAILTDMAMHDKTIKVVSLSRNFGKELATTAGITVSTGDATLLLDADGQHPPHLIGSFVKEWQNGAQVVIGVRGDAADYSPLKRFGSKLYNSLFTSALDTKTVANTTDFRLIDRAVRDEFVKLKEHNRITRGLIDWLGFERAYVAFDAPDRIAGKPTYNMRKLMQLAFHSITSLSIRPLLWLIWTGLAVTVVALLLGVFLLIEQFIMHDPLGLHFTGSALLGVFIAFLVGIVLTSEGILGLYIANVQEQTRGRPLYVVDYVHSINVSTKEKS